MKRTVWMLLAAAVAAGASAAWAQTGRQPLTEQELRLLWNQAPLVVQFEAESRRRTTLDPQLVWEVEGEVLAVLKGDLEPGPLSVHVASIVRAFDRPGADLPGRQYIAGLIPLKDAGRRHYELVAGYAFAADGAEAAALRELAGDAGGKGRPGLELAVKPMQKVFMLRGPKVVAVRLANNTDDSVTYVQAPIIEREGQLFLPGGGSLWIRDETGSVVPDKGTVKRGESPPASRRPEPAVIFPEASFTKTIDLGKYYDLSAGRYTVHLSVASPGERGRLAAEPVRIQVGAVNLPPPPAPEPEPDGGAGAVDRSRDAGGAVPSAGFYEHGEPRSGLAALLRPTQTSFELGEPVKVEFRLVNTSVRTMAVDVRLERTLTFEVTPVGDSPPPRSLRNTILWPEDEPGLPESRAHLREDAFWGRIIDVNWFHGKGEKDLPRLDEVEGGDGFTYERFGRMLFDFHQPGLYRIVARYTVRRPRPPQVEPTPEAESETAAEGETPKEKKAEPVPLDMRWWVGEVESNPVLVRITPPSRRRGR